MIDLTVKTNIVRVENEKDILKDTFLKNIDQIQEELTKEKLSKHRSFFHNNDKNIYHDSNIHTNYFMEKTDFLAPKKHRSDILKSYKNEYQSRSSSISIISRRHSKLHNLDNYISKCSSNSHKKSKI
jgi:hypothetical protein